MCRPPLGELQLLLDSAQPVDAAEGVFPSEFFQPSSDFLRPVRPKASSSFTMKAGLPFLCPPCPADLGPQQAHPDRRLWPTPRGPTPRVSSDDVFPWPTPRRQRFECPELPQEPREEIEATRMPPKAHRRLPPLPVNDVPLHL